MTRDPAINSRAERRDESGIGGVITERSNEAIYLRGCARVSFREYNVATAQRRNREGIVAGRHRFRGKVQGYAETLRRMQTRSENVVVISKSGEIPAKYPVFRILIAFEMVVGSARSSRLVSFSTSSSSSSFVAKKNRSRFQHQMRARVEILVPIVENR